MKNVVESILKHPIATIAILAFASNCTIRIIKTAKGINVDPMLKVTVDGNSGS